MQLGLALVGTVAGIVLIASATAFGVVHVSHATLTSATMSASVVSTGDAGASHGNMDNGTSPIAPSMSGTFQWFNQPTSVTAMTMVDTADSDSDAVVHGMLYQHSTNGSTWGSLTTLSGPLSAEGIYNLAATGTDDETPLATATITPAFGIDMTKPVVTTDRVPVYGGTALVTITATDTLSGIEDLQYSVDGGPFDVSWDAVPGQTFSVPVSFGPGSHTLWWHAFDNAGNINSGSVTFIVRPVSFVPSMTLRAKPLGGAEENSHHVTFSGTMSAMPTAMALTITVQRKVGSSWRAYKSYTMTEAAYASTFSVTKHITADGTFRAIAICHGGVSSWKTFVVR
jgi:tellurite resistance-related uncharacterized protein